MQALLHCAHVEHMSAATLAFVLTFMDRLLVFRSRWVFFVLLLALAAVALSAEPSVDAPLFIMFALVVARAHFASLPRAMDDEKSSCGHGDSRVGGGCT